MPEHVCPTCGRTFTYERIDGHPTYPFCSERCRLAELGAWFDARYVVSRGLDPAEAEDMEEAPPEPPPPPKTPKPKHQAHAPRRRTPKKRPSS